MQNLLMTVNIISLLTPVLESCSDLARHFGEDLLNTFGESLVHGLSSFIITEATENNWLNSVWVKKEKAYSEIRN